MVPQIIEERENSLQLFCCCCCLRFCFQSSAYFFISYIPHTTPNHTMPRHFTSWCRWSKSLHQFLLYKWREEVVYCLWSLCGLMVAFSTQTIIISDWLAAKLGDWLVFKAFMCVNNKRVDQSKRNKKSLKIKIKKEETKSTFLAPLTSQRMFFFLVSKIWKGRRRYADNKGCDKENFSHKNIFFNEKKMLLIVNRKRVSFYIVKVLKSFDCLKVRAYFWSQKGIFNNITSLHLVYLNMKLSFDIHYLCRLQF